MKKVLISLILGLVITMSFISCSGGGGSESVDPAWEDKIKTILLEQKEWIGEINSKWGPCLHDYVFEDRGEKIIVKIHCPQLNQSCKQKIKIKSAGFRMTGCSLGTADLFYDPNDPVFQFKTKGDNLEYDLKLKAI